MLFGLTGQPEDEVDVDAFEADSVKVLERLNLAITQMRCAVKPLQPLQWLHFYDAIARVLQSHRNGFSVALHCHCGNRSERKH